MIWVVLAAVLNAAYVAAAPAPTIFYIANVLLHLALGAAATVWLVSRYRRSPRAALLALAGALGVYLIFAGATRDHRAILIAHVALAVVGLAMLMPRWTLQLAALSALVIALRFGLPADRIRNPKTVPVSMAEEGAGPHSPFWPSSSNTNTGAVIPSNFFMDSKLCGECHKDIYEQWKSSMHHFASFNNRFYRATILHMQELSGTQGSKWCAGCHDHAVFFNGRFERPIKEQVDTPEAQNGLGCMSCHSIVHVGSTMGNGDFTMEYPPLHEIASSHNPYLRKIDAFLTYLNPEPHRISFMKPFMRQQSAEFCAACHKVHLDEPVNHYRWVRGFNEYDNWQASGVSGQGARSFYYPPKSANCADCHMPLVSSHDPGNRDGKVHSHRFPAANTAIPFVNHDDQQLKTTEQFLQSGFITVDLFAASPVEESKGQVQMRRRAGDAPAAASTFAVGEEAEQSGPITLREVGKLAAPIDAPGVRFQPGSSVRVDAVVRTRKIGHFFPAGTVDGFDVWLEFQARDASGRILAWSGFVEDDGKGPVDPGAHFYRSYQLDGAGNPIDKRNAWQTRSVLYVHLIPPGAADTAHFRVDIPKDAVGPVTLETKLNYRKFTWNYTRFAFAGVPQSGSAGVDHDSRHYTYDSAPIPDLPIVTLAKATASVELGTPNWQPVIRKQDRERWNDWGIGLLLQGDLKGAEYAFHRVTEAEPGYADGWLNISRALIREGETDAARPFVEKALALSPDLARGRFFRAMVEKAAGDYDAAIRDLRETLRQYPRDRVSTNQLGRILFLQRHYADAVAAFGRTLDVDPEDLEAHYNLMLCYRGLGQIEKADREEKLFLRFKADEASQALTAKPRLMSPEDNNERQPIHDHISGRFPERAGDRLRAGGD
ncbi:MAG TPA: tetratricopeptide repeat protein [Candidatus Limnocylindrales bacterium]|nr:tetratricopeptide repeat protein [Candidatus Limnocylindrales bacterium]